MRADFSDPQVKASWEKLEARAFRLIKAVEGMSESERGLAPPKGFDSLETIRHLSLTDKFEIDLIRRTPASMTRSPRINIIGRWVIKSLRRAKPVPTMKEMTPSVTGVGDSDALAACREWEASLSEMGGLISAKRAGEVLLKHPIFGLMGPLDVIELMDSHLDYHISRLALVVPWVKELA